MHAAGLCLLDPYRLSADEQLLFSARQPVHLSLLFRGVFLHIHTFTCLHWLLVTLPFMVHMGQNFREL